MGFYYCYVLDERGGIIDREVIEGADDEEAIAAARTFFGTHESVPAIEVWQESRRVITLKRA